MPPKRAAREVAPTRQSKRIRRAHKEGDHDDESPLKVLTHERTKRRAPSSAKKTSNQASTPIASINVADATDITSSSASETQSSPLTDNSSRPRGRAQSHNSSGIHDGLLAYDVTETEESREENHNRRRTSNFQRGQRSRTKLDNIEVNQVADSNFRKSSDEKIQRDTVPQEPKQVQSQEQSTTSPLRERPISKKRTALEFEDVEEAMDERPTKIRRSINPVSIDPKSQQSHAVTPTKHRTAGRAAQSARGPRHGPSPQETDLGQAFLNVIDSSTEFGKHHSDQQEIRKRRQRLLRKRSLAAERILSGITDKTSQNDEGDQSTDGMSTALDPSVKGHEAEPNDQVAKPMVADQPQTPSRNGWGLGSVLNRVGSAISYGYSMFRHSPTSQHSITRPIYSPLTAVRNRSSTIKTDHDETETPTTWHQSKAQSENTTPANRSVFLTPAKVVDEEDHDATDNESDTQMPATPTPSTTTNVTANSSGKRMPRVATPGRTRSGYQERVRKMQEKKRKEEAAEAAQRKAEWDARNMRAEEESQKMKQYFIDHPVPQNDIKEVLRRREQGLQVGFKRKFRVDDLNEIPRPKNGDFGVLDYFEEDSDGEEYCYIDEYGFLSKRGINDVINTDECIRPTATKKVRFAENLETGPTPSKPKWSTGPSTPYRSGSLNDVTPSLTSALKTKPNQSLTSGDPHHAQPYLGTIFAESLDQVNPERNVFDLTRPKTVGSTPKPGQSNAVAYGQKYKVWTGPRVSPQTGSFTVPEDSDSDDESESGADGTDTQDEVDREVTPERQRTDAAAFKSKANSTTPSTPSSLTAAASVIASSTPMGGNDQNALARARSQAEKYKPKTPSALRASSRLSASPVGNKTLPATKDMADDKITGTKSDEAVKTGKSNIFASTNAAITKAASTPSNEKTIQTSDAEEFTTSPSSPSSIEDEDGASNQEIRRKGTDFTQNLDQPDAGEQPIFYFPQGKPTPWAHLLTQELTTELYAWSHPTTEAGKAAFENECNYFWKAAYARYQREGSGV